jgi:hypothetical protein
MSSSRLKMNRRSLLASAGLTGASYFLPTLRPGYAAAAPPKRVLLVYTQQGTLPWLWGKTSGGRTDFQFAPLLTPLDGYKKDMVLLDGVHFRALDLPDGKRGADGHASTQACSLTANKQFNDPSKGGSGDQQSRGTGPSFDYWLARQLEAMNGGKSPTPFTERRMRVMERGSENANWGRPFQDDQNVWIYAAADPLKEFNTLFGGSAMMGMGMGADASAVGRHKSALDFAAGEFGKVADKVGQVEKQRLERHAQIVRELQQSLESRASSASTCMPTIAAPPASYLDSGTRWKHTSTNFLKLVQSAFACDLTRVASLQVEYPLEALYGGLDPAKLGGVNGLHDLVHTLNMDLAENQDKNRLSTVKGFYTEITKFVKSVADMLAETKDSDGSRLLDNTIVLWCGEIATPSHTYDNCKWATIGGAKAGIKTGQFLEFARKPSNGDVFTSIAEAMGVKGKKFGHPDATVGPIPGMLA